MNINRCRLLYAIAATLIAGVASGDWELRAQNANDEDNNGDEEEVFELSPFEVRSDTDGYRATHTISGSSLNTEYSDVAATVEVLTPEFMEDIGAVTLEEALDFTVSIQSTGEYINSEDNGLGSVINPENNNQVRGIGMATRTSDFTETNLRIDSYNSERITIATGAEAILFGMGRASGIINTSSKRANIQNSITEFETRFDSNDSSRYTFDIGRPILEGKFAIRFAGLDDKARGEREPNFDHDRRLYSTFTWQPMQKATFRYSYETAERRTSKAPNTLPEDQATPLLNIVDEGGERLEVYEAFMTERINANWGNFLDDWDWEGQAYTSAEWPRPNARFNSNNRIMIFQNDLLNRPAQPILANDSQGLKLAKAPTADTYFYQNPLNLLVNQMKFRDDERLNPFGNFWGEGNIVTKDTQKHAATLDLGVTDNLHLLFNYAEEYSLEKRASQFANGRYSVQIDADPFQRDASGFPLVSPEVGVLDESTGLYELPEGADSYDKSNYLANPNYTHFFVKGAPNGRLRERYNDSLRGALAYEFDFAQKSDSLGWLGSHRFAAQYETKSSWTIQQVSERRAYSPGISLYGPESTYIAGLRDAGKPLSTVTVNKTLEQIEAKATSAFTDDGYVKDNQLNAYSYNSNYLNNTSHETEFFNYMDPDNPFIPVFQDVEDTWVLDDLNGDPYNVYLFDNPFGYTGRPSGNRRKTNSEMLALQSYFLNRKLVTTLGYRGVDTEFLQRERLERSGMVVPGVFHRMVDKRGNPILTSLDADGQMYYDPVNGQAQHWVESSNGYYIEDGKDLIWAQPGDELYDADSVQAMSSMTTGIFPHYREVPYRDEDPQRSSGSNRNLGAVYKVNRMLSLQAKYSTNFEPPNERYSPFGALLGSNHGESANIGLRLRLMEDALNVRVDYIDASNNDVGASGEIQRRSNRVETFVQAGLENVNLELWESWVDRNQETYGQNFFNTEDEDWRSLYQIKSDRENTGVEWSVTYQPNRNWRFLLNGSRSEAVERNIGGDYFEWLDYLKTDLVENYYADLSTNSDLTQFRSDLWDITWDPAENGGAAKPALIPDDPAEDLIASTYYYYADNGIDRMATVDADTYNSFIADIGGDPEDLTIDDYFDWAGLDTPADITVVGWENLMQSANTTLEEYWDNQIDFNFIQYVGSLDGRQTDSFSSFRANFVASYGFIEGPLKGLRISANARARNKPVIGYLGVQREVNGEVRDYWDIDNPVYGSSHIPIGITFNYTRNVKDARYKMGVAINDLFPRDEPYPIASIPGEDADGNITNEVIYAGWGIPNDTSYKFSLSVEF